MKELIRRSYNFDVRAESTERGYILTGRPIVYDQRTNLGAFDEIIDRGALDAADLRDVRFLVNHDVKKIPLARSRRNNGNSTMQLTPDFEGLSLDWVQLDIDNNAEARALYSAVQRKDITGMSFMFNIDGETGKTSKATTRPDISPRSAQWLKYQQLRFPHTRGRRYTPETAKRWTAPAPRWRTRDSRGRRRWIPLWNWKKQNSIFY